MKITLTTGYQYDLANNDELSRLKRNIPNMIRRQQNKRIVDVYNRIKMYRNYSGPNQACNNAKELALFIEKKNLADLNPPGKELASKHHKALSPKPPIPVSSSLTGSEQPAPLPLVTHIISMAPLNSSGDIYHILAYLILCQASQQQMPMVQLNYDIEPQNDPSHSNITVGNQVNRSIDFAGTIGLGEYFTKHKLEFNGTGREKVRQSQLENYFIEHSENKNICYTDQMATTPLISDYVLKYGYEPTTTILRDGFSKRHPTKFPKSAQKKVDHYVAACLNQLKSNALQENQPLVVLHIRYSSHANSQLNLPDSYVNGVATYLSEKQYQVCFILADDRQGKAHYMEKNPQNRSYPMLEPFKVKGLLIDSVDYTKQAHLQLLLGIKNYAPIGSKMVVGNTSGTLDIAGMIGLATFCIHQFSKTRLSYQECRLYFQLAFLSLGALILDEADYVLEDPGLDSWLEKPKPTAGISLFNQNPDKKSMLEKVQQKKGEAGYSKMFYHHFFNKKTESLVEIQESASALEALQKL